jgi:hypothetical protein
MDKISVYDKLYKRHWLGVSKTITPNDPAVWLGAVCVAVTCFLPVQIDGSEISCHDEIVSVKSKKQGASASADSANDAVPVDETVRGTQYFINGTEFKNIDFRIDWEAVLAMAKALN